jgi:hypothetical protein
MISRLRPQTQTQCCEHTVSERVMKKNLDNFQGHLAYIAVCQTVRLSELTRDPRDRLDSTKSSFIFFKKILTMVYNFINDLDILIKSFNDKITILLNE